MAYLRVVDNIFSEDECKKLIEMINNQNLELVDRSIATYNRYTFRDASLANRLYHQLYNILPIVVDGQKVCGVNDTFRCSKYEPGQKFGIHKDGINQDSKGNRFSNLLNRRGAC